MKKVYLMCVESSDDIYYKIGVSKNTKNRIKNLSTGNHLDVNVIKEIKSEFPTKLEKRLHKHFENKKIKGEWFSLNQADLEAFDSICDKYEKIFNSLKENPFFNI